MSSRPSVAGPVAGRSPPPVEVGVALARSPSPNANSVLPSHPDRPADAHNASARAPDSVLAQTQNTHLMTLLLPFLDLGK